ncbi:MAG: DUF2341 domain-containing protein [Polyangiaceae bacterium]|nr:DUF2341 domain-containing protein [Polyangiaceae bacterium]
MRALLAFRQRPLAAITALAVFVAMAGAACGLDSGGLLANSGTVPESSNAGGGGGGGGGDTGGMGGMDGSGGMVSTSSSGGGGGAGGQGGEGPVSPYLYRRPITITAGDAPIPPDYSVAIQLDHSSLVLNDKSLPNGNDVRVFRTNGSSYEEIHRVLDPTSTWNSGATILWFRLKADIPAATTDSSYFIYYGDPDAPKPPDDGAQVYLVWDDFTGPSLDPAWTFEPIGSAKGVATQTSGVVAITASTGDIWSSQDNFVFLHRPVSGDFVADTLVTAVGGTTDEWGKLGGVMIRENNSAGSRNRLMSPVFSAKARTNSYRLKDGNNTSENTVNGTLKLPELDRVTRMGNKSNAYWSTDLQVFEKLGNEITFGTALSPSVLVGIPVCNIHGSDVTVSVDWFRVRRLVNPEPTVALLPEEEGTF